jgi:hypothetical protein
MTDAVLVGAFFVATVGLLALLAVFIFWGGSNSTAALPYFAVPGALFAASGVIGYRAVRLGALR